jgi:hypothetical protein
MINFSENDLQARAPQLIGQLKERLGGLRQSEDFVEEILKLIANIETEVGKQNYQAAVGMYNDAFDRIEKAEVSIRTNSLAWRLLWVEFGYLFFLLALGYLTFKFPDYFVWKGFVNLYFQTVWFGALGGVTISIYGIYSHIQMRNFDPKYKLWYICKPIMGGIFGWFVYMIYSLGFVSVQGKSADSMQIPQVAFLIAFLAGFSERFTIKMIDKLMAVLTTFEETTTNGGSKTALPKV